MKLNKTTKLAIAAAVLGAVLGPSIAFAAQDKQQTPTEVNLTLKPEQLNH